MTALPKAELHLHIEGTLEPEMVFALAERNGIALPYASVDELRAKYSFHDLQSFLDLYYVCMDVLLTRADFHDLAIAYFERAWAQGVRHAELFFDLQAHTARGVAEDAVIGGLTDAFATFQRDHDFSGGLILCFLRHLPPEEALATLESVAGRPEILGVGLDSAEVGFPPHLFVEVFDRARELGLHVVAHAGEEGPPAYIWEALDLLRVERIDHGIRCLEDDALVARLRDDGVPLTVCPLSNVRLRAVDTIADHPLRRMLELDLVVTINSDDPAYFGGYAGDNFAAVADALGLDDDHLRRLAANSVTASFAAPERKAALSVAVAEWPGRP
jgi:adenosine deaminase